jgi:regulator of sigma E protease
MAVLSINLGFVNLLPIPILDGGHLMFFTVEALRRRPLSQRAREIASAIGLAIILCCSSSSRCATTCCAG